LLKTVKGWFLGSGQYFGSHSQVLANDKHKNKLPKTVKGWFLGSGEYFGGNSQVLSNGEW